MGFEVVVILLLFIAAAALLLVEVFLPAHGLIGAVGVILLLAAVGVVFYHNQWAGVGLAYALAAATPFVIVLWMKIWPRTPIGRRLILPGPPKFDERTVTAVPGVAIGQTGVTASELRPGGTCDFAGERIGCTAEYGMISPGTTVRVIAVVDGHPVVRPA